MTNAVVTTGTLTDPKTLVLDEQVVVPTGRVRVVIESIEPRPKPDLARFFAELKERQAARGHVPRTREQIDADLRAERENWGD